MEWCPHCQKLVNPMDMPFFDELKIIVCPECHIGLSVDVPKEDLENAIQQR